MSSRSAGLQKLSVQYLRVYHFKSSSVELSDYLVKLETDPASREPCFAVYYGFLRAHRLFLFSNDASQQCKQVVNLEQCTVRDSPLDRQWPACCASGCQIWLPGCYSGASAAATAATAAVPASEAGCWQLGFFSGSKWKRCLDAYAKQAGQSAVADATDAEYDNDEYDAGDTELSGLWAELAELDPGQVGSTQPALPPKPFGRPTPGPKNAASVAALRSGFQSQQAGAAKPTPPPPPGPKPNAVGRAAPGPVQPPLPTRRTPEKQASAQGGSPTPPPPQPPPQPTSNQTLLDTPVPPLQNSQKPAWPPTSQSAAPTGGPRFPQLRSVLRQQQEQLPTCSRAQQTPPPASQPQPQPPPPAPKPFDKPNSAAGSLNEAPQPPPLPLKMSQPTPPPPPPPPAAQPESQSPKGPPIPPRDGRGAAAEQSLAAAKTAAAAAAAAAAAPAVKQPPMPPPPPALLPPQAQAQPASDLYDLMSRSLCIDALCSYFCRGYYSAKDMGRARQLMKQSSDNGVYMLRGFCNKQAGQDKTLCVKYSMVYKFRIRVLQNGFQIWNEHNHQVHSSMEALLFYHHLFPIRVAQQIQHELLLRRPYDLDPEVCQNNLMLPLGASLWSHGSKEMCAEILRNSEDGTYTLRYDQESGGAVLCVTHRSQILKFRVVAPLNSDGKREFGFHHLPAGPKFGSLEEFIVHHHKNPIRGSSADGNIILMIPFQLVPRCQQELDFQHISLDDSIYANGQLAAVSNKVSRMRVGNFQVLRRFQQQQQQQQQQQPNSVEDSDAAGTAGAAAAAVEHLLIVRDDNGTVRNFRIIERDTDLSFRPQKTFTLAERPELVTDRVEKMVHFLCIANKFLSPDITCLVKP